MLMMVIGTVTADFIQDPGVKEHIHKMKRLWNDLEEKGILFECCFNYKKLEK